MYRTLAGKLGIAWYQEGGISGSAFNTTREVITFLRDVHGRDNLEVPAPKAEDTNTPAPPSQE